jgi:hypothetical protein
MEKIKYFLRGSDFRCNKKDACGSSLEQTFEQLIEIPSNEMSEYSNKNHAKRSRRI